MGEEKNMKTDEGKGKKEKRMFYTELGVQVHIDNSIPLQQ